MTQQLTLSAARKARKPALTQVELAALVGVDQTYISLIEAGKRMPSDDLKERLGKALGIAPSKLRFTALDPPQKVAKGRDRGVHVRNRSAAEVGSR